VVVAEAAVVVPVIPVTAERVLRPPLPGMLRGLEHLVRVTEPMVAGTPVLLGSAKLVRHLRVLVGLLLDRAIREFPTVLAGD
jgi:hypothetical protein